MVTDSGPTVPDTAEQGVPAGSDVRLVGASGGEPKVPLRILESVDKAGRCFRRTAASGGQVPIRESAHWNRMVAPPTPQPLVEAPRTRPDVGLCAARRAPVHERPVNAVRQTPDSQVRGRRIGLDQGGAPSYGLNVKTGTFNK